MSAQTIAIPAHYKAITTKQQTVSATSTVLTALVPGTDAVLGRPDNIFVQALAGNTGKIYINNTTAVVGGAGFELPPGANINLPGTNPAGWFIIGTAGDKLNIVYQGGAS